MAITFLGFFFLAFTTVGGSFLAVGPPAAPRLRSLGSANSFVESEFKVKFHSSQVRYSLGLNATQTWNASSDTNQTGGVNTQQRNVDIGPGHFWLSDSGYEHRMPYAGDGYQVFRDVKQYGAKGDGTTDDWAAIQAAITDGNRCGGDCKSTSTKGAIIYFPPGKYAISQPIVQYYYTAFIGDPNNKPTIKPLPGFTGIALIDTDFYDATRGGDNWWVNQNNFYRQIRNFVIDIRDMENTIVGGPEVAGEKNRPCGIHWQVSQTCTLQNIDFLLPQSSDSRHVGIFQENGSGGFVSDLSFFGGKYCWAAGSQQYTGRNIKFRGCDTAIYMIWDWGWTWKNIDVQNSRIAIDASEVSKQPDKDTGRHQSTGSLTIVDSKFVKVEEVIRIPKDSSYRPAIFIDNIVGQGVKSTVKEDGGEEILNGGNVDQWGLGWRFTDDNEQGIKSYGPMIPNPKKPSALLRSGAFFERSKPQYEIRSKGDFLNVLRFGAKNDGSLASASKNTESINNAMRASAGTGKVLLFPAGVYPVNDTIVIPVGTRVQGALWSQIMAVGLAFGDPKKPKVLAQVGKNEGDEGVIEISDVAFTTSGNSAGAVLVEWNAHEKEQGSAAMWDVLVRVGGAQGTDLTIDKCHWNRALKQNADSDMCMASSLLLHVKPKASIYLENAWLWVADHDIESVEQTRVNVYGARGALIESKGPSWFHSVSNEHNTLYNWQLSGAENIYLGQIQSETPYFQAGQTPAQFPYTPGASVFNSDPTFDHCFELKPAGDLNGKLSNSGKLGRRFAAAPGDPDICREAWALRIIDSSQVYIYGGGFYSFFKNYLDTCSKNETGICQQRLIDTSYSEEIWMYGLYTVGSKEVISPQGDRYDPVEQKKTQNGFATAVSSWLLLAGTGKKHLGGTRGGAKGNGHKPDDTKKDIDKDVCKNFVFPMESISCSRTDFQNRLDITSAEAWDKFNGTQKWCEVMKKLRTVKRDAKSFDEGKTSPSVKIALFLNHTNPDEFRCGAAAGSGCGGVTCVAPMEAPGMLILNSLVHLSEWTKQLTDGWESSLTHSFPYVSDMRKDFAPERPKEDDGLALKIILDIVGIGFLAVSHGTWHNAFKPAAKEIAEAQAKKAAEKGKQAADKVKLDPKNGKKNVDEVEEMAKKASDAAIEQAKKNAKLFETNADVLRDWVNMVPSAGFGLWKDTMTEKNKDDAAWKVAQYLEAAVSSFQAALNTQAKRMFDGLLVNDKEDHLDYLDGAIRSGVLSRFSSENAIMYNKFELMQAMRPVLYQNILPQVWQMEVLRHPVIIMEGGRHYPKKLPPKMEGKKEDKIWGVVPGKPEESNELITIKDLNKVTVEYDGKVLFLLQSLDCANFKPRPPITSPTCARGICLYTSDESLNRTATGNYSNYSVEQVNRIQQAEEQMTEAERASEWGCTTKAGHGLSKLPGWDQLWKYNVTAQNIAISAYKGWQLNQGNAPPHKTIENYAAYAKESFMNDDASGIDNPQNWQTMPGLSNIPVCDWATWKANHKAWGNSERKDEMPCPEYPCCPLDKLKKYGWDDRNHDQGYLGRDDNMVTGLNGGR